MGFNIESRGAKFDIYRFNKYLSEIRIEAELLKTNKARRTDLEVEQHLSEIGQSLSGITEMLLDYVEKTGKHEIVLADQFHHAKEELVGLRIRRAMLDISKSVHDQVLQALYREYHCTWADCYEHPEYLKEILKQAFGGAHVHIVKSIKNQLDEFDEHKPIKEFLTVMTK